MISNNSVDYCPNFEIKFGRKDKRRQSKYTVHIRTQDFFAFNLRANKISLIILINLSILMKFSSTLHFVSNTKRLKFKVLKSPGKMEIESGDQVDEIFDLSKLI